jgi:hypothetical protein
MTKIEIDTADVARYVFYLVVIVLIASLSFAIGANVYRSESTPSATAIAPTPTTPAPTPAYPTTLTYTVLSMTTSGGHYQIYTMAGQTLYCANYYDYNAQYPRFVYTATVTGMDGSAYIITTPTTVAYAYETSSYEEPGYYYFNDGKYYDAVTAREVSWNRARSGEVINDYYRR